MGPLSTRVSELAQAYVGKTETMNNDALWLRQLRDLSGNPDHWMPGESYCIAVLLMLFDIACKEQDMKLPFPTSLSTRAFYEGARDAGWAMNGPEPMKTFEAGDIAIYSDGTRWQGHAGFVVATTPEGIDTIEFNTSDNSKGNQRNGGGCFTKTRLFSQFAPPSATHLWLRGSVKTSRL